MNNRFRTLFLLGLTSSALAACGGGDGGENTPFYDCNAPISERDVFSDWLFCPYDPGPMPNSGGPGTSGSAGGSAPTGAPEGPPGSEFGGGTSPFVAQDRWRSAG